MANDIKVLMVTVEGTIWVMDFRSERKPIGLQVKTTYFARDTPEVEMVLVDPKGAVFGDPKLASYRALASYKAIPGHESDRFATAEDARIWAKRARISSGSVSFDWVTQYGPGKGAYENIAWYMISDDGQITPGGNKEDGFVLPPDARIVE